MNDSSESSPQEAQTWLLVLPQIPAKPDYFRVKVRRRLDQIGAILVKHGVYALPATDDALEDARWLRGEIVGEGGDAILVRAQLVDGLRDEDLRQELHEAGHPTPSPATAARPPRGTTWVTREGVKIDRTASAWLIRRFLDPEARFAFVPATGYRPAPGEVRFDMFDGEFTHEGDRCTFEVLLARFGLTDPALLAIAEIVHDLDCKDEKYRRPETPGVGLVIEGIVRTHGDDAGRLAAAGTVYEGLYRRFRGA